MGGWSYSGTPVIDVTAPTGFYVYPLSAGSVTLSSYDNTKSYVLSLWSNGTAPTVNSGSALTGTALKTTNGWTYYEFIVPVSASAITISGTVSIDELRLYPVSAQMTTYAYDPSGIRSIMDAKSEPGYFEYDFFQRLKNIKDYNGNIVNNYGYHTYDQTIGNDAQGPSTFTRNNCPSGTTSNTTTYSVAANKYLSSTKASANAEATYDLNINGQLKANTVCSCLNAVAFTLTNNTGRSGYQVTFSGIATPYNFPTTGSTVVYIPYGTYATVTTNSVGTFTATFTLGTLPPQPNVHFGSFSSVVIAYGGSNSFLTIQ